MPDESMSDFELHPWYHALLAAPHITPQSTTSRETPYPNPDQAHSFLSSTLFTATGVRAMQSFHARVSFDPSTTSSSVLPLPTSQFANCGGHRFIAGGTSSQETSKDAPLDEWLVCVSLGTGLNGPEGIVHGGLTMTLLDSTMAVRASRAAGVNKIVTTRFEARFKMKIKAPCVLLCRAWLDEGVMGSEGDGNGSSQRGSRDHGKEVDVATIYTRGTVEDGMGNIHLEATAHFANQRKSVRAKL